MTNVNVFDMMCEAVEDYNNYATRKDLSKLSYEEKRGILYNALRRKFGTLSKVRRDSTSLSASDIICTFDIRGVLVSFRISKTFKVGAWDGDIDLSRMTTLKMLKEASDNHEKFYQHSELNEMARIINSIKTT